MRNLIYLGNQRRVLVHVPCSGGQLLLIILEAFLLTQEVFNKEEANADIILPCNYVNSMPLIIARLVNELNYENKPKLWNFRGSEYLLIIS